MPERTTEAWIMRKDQLCQPHPPACQWKQDPLTDKRKWPTKDPFPSPFRKLSIRFFPLPPIKWKLSPVWKPNHNGSKGRLGTKEGLSQGRERDKRLDRKNRKWKCQSHYLTASITLFTSPHNWQLFSKIFFFFRKKKEALFQP